MGSCSSGLSFASGCAWLAEQKYLEHRITRERQGRQAVESTAQSTLVHHPGTLLANGTTNLEESRGPLREAIHRLEGQRLLLRVPHVGARVVSLTLDELVELYQIREALEGLACRHAAERMSQSEVDQLRYVLDAHEKDAAFQAGTGYYQQEGMMTSITRSFRAAKT